MKFAGDVIPYHLRRFSPSVGRLFVLLAVFAAGCAPFARRPHPAPTPGPRVEKVPIETLGSSEGLAVVWTPGPAEDLLAAATFFHLRPHMKVSAVFSNFSPGQGEKEQEAYRAMAALVESGRIEPVMTVPGEPLLALLQDTDVAASSAGGPLSLPPRFSWPEDVLGHLVLGRSEYRRWWRRSPDGLVMPGGVFTGPEVLPLRKIGMRWALLLEGTGRAGCFGGLPIAVVRPFTPFYSDPARLLDAWARPEPGTPAPPLRARSLAELESLDRWFAARPGVEWKTLTEYIGSVDQLPVWPGLDAEPPDFSPWIGEAEENAAWRLLAMTRQAVEDYKNSGEANVKNLDLALREVYQAESGRYFLAFGGDHETAHEGDLKQEFMATLAQTYRLMGKTVPPYLMEDLGSGAVSDDADVSESATTFQRSGNSWRWTDPARDDRGPGHYFYPVGDSFAPGSWDLRSFELRVGETNVSFLFEFTALPNPWAAPNGFSFPLVDVYLDINRLSGAGSERLLAGRTGIVESQNAWEYAISLNGWNGGFYQYSPRLEPRRLEALSPKLLPGGTGFRVDVPRRHFRGNPDRWGYAVLVMGMDPDSVPRTVRAGTGVDSRPLPVGPEPDHRRFGGAWEGAVPPGRADAPPYLDILVPPGDSQSRLLGVYKQGREVVVPFVRPQY
jgi:hypothetical protein